MKKRSIVLAAPATLVRFSAAALFGALHADVDEVTKAVRQAAGRLP